MVCLMSFVANLRRTGFTVWLEGNLVEVGPSKLLKPGQLDYLKANKRYIVVELELEKKAGVKLE